MFSHDDEFQDEKPHFIQCDKCAMHYDTTNLSEVLYHQFDHSRNSMSEYSEEITCTLCGYKHFAAVERNGSWLGVECEQCGQMISMEDQAA